MFGLLTNPHLTTIVYLSFPILGGYFHLTSAMGDSYGAKLTLNVPIYMSLGDAKTNPYNFEIHYKCHQQSLAFDPSRCSVMFSYALIPIS